MLAMKSGLKKMRLFSRWPMAFELEILCGSNDTKTIPTFSLILILGDYEPAGNPIVEPRILTDEGQHGNVCQGPLRFLTI